VAEIDTHAGERTAAELEALGGRGLFVPTDVSERAQVEHAVAATVARFGRIDVVVNNAWGGGTVKRLQDKTDDEMLHGVRLAYLAAFWMMQAAFPPLTGDMENAGATVVDAPDVVDRNMVSCRGWPDLPEWSRAFINVLERATVPA